ncbi:MAG: DNA mismatch repair endonuclease MutL [Clostridia bacterium]|nr:DNA mismatch repair endonuclease MutL [Clostridia bacterium]
MPKIHVLDQEIANKIAAGEVVERPGSVIKELVENAMDAGAQHITVEIKNGGVTYMRVTDDGCGMSMDDARNCFLRHATSKIRDISDLYAIETLGFRGEALAAISAVSRIELVTVAEGIGTRLVLEGGKEISCEETGAPQGTTITVQDLFFNTPARMKFLKTDRAESSYIAALMDRLAISNPQIAFKLIQDGKATLNTDGSGKLLDVIYAVMGREVTKGMLQADSTVQQVRVYGYVAEPTVTKPNRNYQLCYINGRLVRSQTVFAAIDQAYRNDLFHGRQAICVLKINLPFGLVDVNVHPSKMEVKFSNEKLIFEAVYYAIKNALKKQTLKKAEEEPTKPIAEEKSFPVAPKTAVVLPAKKEPVNSFGAVTVLSRPEPIQPVKKTETVIKPSQEIQESPDDRVVTLPPRSPFASKNSFLHDNPVKPIPPEKEKKEEPAPAVEQQTIVKVESEPIQQTIVAEEKQIPYRFIGEAFAAYLLVESGDQLYLIDKHAAHERMIFERLLKENKAEKRAHQRMLVPERIRLSQEELSFALEHREHFEKLGFEIDEFGDRQIVLRSRPVCLTSESATEAFTEILSGWLQGGRINSTERENLALKTVACKAAIKAGNINDMEELKALVSKLIRDDEIHQCPHGRPIMIAYSKKTIEKAFKRI